MLLLYNTFKILNTILYSVTFMLVCGLSQNWDLFKGRGGEATQQGSTFGGLYKPSFNNLFAVKKLLSAMKKKDCRCKCVSKYILKATNKIHAKRKQPRHCLNNLRRHAWYEIYLQLLRLHIQNKCLQTHTVGYTSVIQETSQFNPSADLVFEIHPSSILSSPLFFFFFFFYLLFYSVI